MAFDPANLTPIRLGLGWQFVHPDGPRIVLDRITPRSSGLEAWVEIRWGGNVPDPRLLVFGRKDLTGTRTVADLARLAQQAMPTPAIPWSEMLTFAVYHTVSDFQDGGDAVRLHEVTPSKSKWLMRPFVAAAGATRLIAAGGSGKSYLGLAVATAVASGRTGLLGLKPEQTGPVLYLDWEADADTHAERLAQICRGASIDPPTDILYQRCRLTLHRHAYSLDRLVAAEGIRLVIVDSVMLARGSSGENGTYEDSTVRMYEGLNLLGVPALLIDHKNADQVRKGKRGGYGSIVMTNSARLEWDMTAISQVNGKLQVRMSETKANNVGRLGDLAWELEFDGAETATAVRIRQINAATVTALSVDEGSLPDRIESTIRAEAEPMKVEELSRQLGASPDSIRRALNRNMDRFENLGWVGGSGLWTIKEWASDVREALPDPM